MALKHSWLQFVNQEKDMAGEMAFCMADQVYAPSPKLQYAQSNKCSYLVHRFFAEY